MEMTAAALTALLDRCRQELPNEACGFLAGHAGRIEQVYPVTNTEPSPDWFSMDPLAQMQVFDAIDAAGQQLLAIYHSHPLDPARPSPEDLANAGYPDLVNVIVSLQADPPDVRAYRYQGNTYAEEKINLICRE